MARTRTALCTVQYRILPTVSSKARIQLVYRVSVRAAAGRRRRGPRARRAAGDKHKGEPAATQILERVRIPTTTSWRLPQPRPATIDGSTRGPQTAASTLGVARWTAPGSAHTRRRAPRSRTPQTGRGTAPRRPARRATTAAPRALPHATGGTSHAAAARGPGAAARAPRRPRAPPDPTPPSQPPCPM